MSTVHSDLRRCLWRGRGPRGAMDATFQRGSVDPQGSILYRLGGRSLEQETRSSTGLEGKRVFLVLESEWQPLTEPAPSQEPWKSIGMERILTLHPTALQSSRRPLRQKATVPLWRRQGQKQQWLVEVMGVVTPTGQSFHPSAGLGGPSEAAFIPQAAFSVRRSHMNLPVQASPPWRLDLSILPEWRGSLSRLWFLQYNCWDRRCRTQRDMEDGQRLALLPFILYSIWHGITQSYFPYRFY